MISLRCWLQNMGLWHCSCLSLCAQSKAFLILCCLCIVVPHRRGNLKSNTLFQGLLGSVTRPRELLVSSAQRMPCRMVPLLFPECAMMETCRKYVWCVRACSLNATPVVLAVGQHCIIFPSNRCSFQICKNDCNCLAFLISFFTFKHRLVCSEANVSLFQYLLSEKMLRLGGSMKPKLVNR